MTGQNSDLPIAATIPPSPLHEMFRAVEHRERNLATDVTKLHIGEPFFGPPVEVAEALVDAVRRGDTRYDSVEGLLELRECVVEKLESVNDLDTSVSRVVVSPGSCQGLAALLRTLAEPGAEILLPELHWPVHLMQSLLAGLRPVFYPLDAGMRPDPEAILASAGPRTRVLVLNSPANPTGAVCEPKLVEAVVQLAHAHRWQVISDEAYEDFVYGGSRFSPATCERGVPAAERLVHSVYSFSKSFGMTGYRLGYVATANDRTAATLRVVQEASIIGPSTPIQYAGIAAMGIRSVAEANRKSVLYNRDTALPALRAAGLLRELPAGGWYAMLDIGRSGLDAETFSMRLLEHKNVAVVPGTGFALHPEQDSTGAVRSITVPPWARNLVRIAICVEPDVLVRGVQALLDFVADCAME